jgi:hypothetical protein
VAYTMHERSDHRPSPVAKVAEKLARNSKGLEIDPQQGVGSGTSCSPYLQCTLAPLSVCVRAEFIHQINLAYFIIVNFRNCRVA